MKVYEVSSHGCPGARLILAKKGPAMESFNRRCANAPHIAHTLILHRVKPINKETVVALVDGKNWAERSEVIAYHAAVVEPVAA
jgi:hypothetical protein